MSSLSGANLWLIVDFYQSFGVLVLVFRWLINSGRLPQLTAKASPLEMIGQKTINSFFAPVSKKRVSKELNDTEEDAKDPVSVNYFSKLINLTNTKTKVYFRLLLKHLHFSFVLDPRQAAWLQLRSRSTRCSQCCQPRDANMRALAPLYRPLLKPVSLQAFPTSLCFAQCIIKTIQKKKQKPELEPHSPSAAALSSEQLDRIARNKRAALEKRASAQTPPEFGESWRKELAAEFAKPYFKQVETESNSAFCCLLTRKNCDVFMCVSQLMSFVSDERNRHTVYPPAEHVFTWTQTCAIRDVSSGWPRFMKWMSTWRFSL